MMGFLNNIKSSIDDKSSISVGAVALLISAIVSFILGLVICFALIYDVTTNGYLKTDLVDVGILLLFDGAYVAGSGAPKTIIDARLSSKGLKKRKSVCLMNKTILDYINKCEGWKTAIKQLHWDADNLSQHKLCDDIAEKIADFKTR